MLVSLGRSEGMAQCRDCDSIKIFPGVNEGDGKCDVCHGTGLGGALDQFAASIVQEESECWKCDGTGQCQTCGGTGVVDE